MSFLLLCNQNLTKNVDCPLNSEINFVRDFMESPTHLYLEELNIHIIINVKYSYYNKLSHEISDNLFHVLDEQRKIIYKQFF